MERLNDLRIEPEKGLDGADFESAYIEAMDMLFPRKKFPIRPIQDESGAEVLTFTFQNIGPTDQLIEWPKATVDASTAYGLPPNVSITSTSPNAADGVLDLTALNQNVQDNPLMVQAMELFYPSGFGSAQINEPIIIEAEDADGTGCEVPILVNTEIERYQFQGNKITHQFDDLVFDGFTYFKFTLLVGETITFVVKYRQQFKLEMIGGFKKVAI